MREYSRALDLRTLDPQDWVTGEDGAWEAERRVDLVRHYPLIPASQSRYLSRIDAMEWKAKRIVEYPHPHRPR